MLYSRLYKNEVPWSWYITQQKDDRDGGDNLAKRDERGDDDNAFSEWRLPDVACEKSFGFSEDDLLVIEKFLQDNESIIWDDWRKEMREHAKSPA